MPKRNCYDERITTENTRKQSSSHNRSEFRDAGTEGQFTPFVEQTNEVYETIFNANVRGVFWSMKHEAKAMLARGGGSIINNASMGGIIGFANAALYIASKHAVLADRGYTVS
jgi:NAD(P)-dependent dehydrogenase (short-subunit alcohol dehydrogenase family)